MAQVLANLVRDTTTTTGTGAKTLAGVAPLHHRTLAAAGAVTSDTVYLRISHATLNEWEVGNYTYNATGPTVTLIGAPLASSNAGAAVAFSAGTKDVAHVVPAEFLEKSPHVSATAPADPYVDPWWVTLDGSLFFWDGAAWAQVASNPGIDGREVQFQVTATHIQWRYVGVATWTDLIALSAITGTPGTPGVDGDDGDAVELQTNATHVQWRYVGAPSWTDLIALSSITGPQGDQGIQGIQGSQGITGSGGPTSVSLSADQAFSATAIADVTNMPTLALAANTDYMIELIGSFTSAATTTGIGVCLNVGGTVTRISGTATHPVSATAVAACSQEANNAVTGATTGVRATGVPVFLRGFWHVRMGATGGNCQLRCRSEIASSAVTLQAGMRMRAFVL